MADNKNVVEFGLENLHIAEYDETAGTYKKPEKVPNVVSLKLKNKMEQINLYADDGVFFSLINNNGYTGDLEIYNFDDDFKEKYLGFKKDKNGVLFEPSVIVQKSFALLFKILGDKSDRCTVLYKVALGKGEVELKTKADKTEIKVLKIPIIATPAEFKDFDGKVVQASTIDKDKKASWFTTVYVPVKNEV